MRDEGGAPIEGATAKLILFLRGEDFGVPLSGGGDAVAADETGSFTISELEEGDYTAKAAAGGYETGIARNVTVAPGARPERVELTLKKGLAISGSVTDESGSPLSSARVRAFGSTEAGFCSRSATSGEGGSYEIGSLSPGCRAAEAAVTVAGGKEVRISLTLEKSGRRRMTRLPKGAG